MAMASLLSASNEADGSTLRARQRQAPVPALGTATQVCRSRSVQLQRQLLTHSVVLAPWSGTNKT
eukprot:CAMPEP_0204074318 /NCGR_PEP_ID=MMETSP0360-20130528/164634_1 /ASSEMBLY_ACC=CAM_ASM_000342 /TAXON_ID=268821 /ORGANISM="Scrippsiella Hangoei, Strain SHTV-5" /LENGTH=64 /DNA_ID=CAMNT_0051022765 /DNA_START=40 /DNA_END=230 /DNA_ORIENTATION=+